MITRQQWLTLFAAQAGYMLDAMDVLLFVFTVNVLRGEFGLSAAQAGLVSSVTLLFSAIGGIVFGAISDRIGRAKTMVISILIYSAASAGTATSWNLATLLVWRGIMGIGLGAEWSAGALLVAETWPAKYRARAISFMQSGWSLGYLLAAGMTALILPHYGWKALFIAGLFPALVALWLQRKLHEPEIWRAAVKHARPDYGLIFRGALRSRTILGSLLSVAVMFAYWGFFTWIPAFLSTPTAKGGPGLTILQSTGFVVPMQIGAFLGYSSFGWVADRIGRRVAFALYVAGAAALVPLYGSAHSESTLLLLGPFIGFFGSGYFSAFGTMLAELYPTSVRGTAQGFIYNIGRGLSSLAPFTVGALADRHGLGASLGLSSGFYLLAALLVFTLPETKEAELTSVSPA